MISRTLLLQAQRTALRNPTIVTSRSSGFFRSSALPAATVSVQPRPFSIFASRMATPGAAETDVEAENVQQMTGHTPETLKQTLLASDTLKPSHVDIQDISGGCGASFAALIVSDAFQGKSALQRHRLVNGLLKEEIKAIHAWTPKCLTGEQWEKEKARMG